MNQGPKLQAHVPLTHHTMHKCKEKIKYLKIATIEHCSPSRNPSGEGEVTGHIPMEPDLSRQDRDIV